MPEPTNPQQAVEAMFDMIATTAARLERPLEHKCRPAFIEGNRDRVAQVFNKEFWDKSKTTLHAVAELHAMTSVGLSKLKAPDSREVSLELFIEAGYFVKQHCPPTGSTGDGPRPRGQWCTWP